MVIFGAGQGLGLSALTTGGMAGVGPRDAGVAGGLVNVAHHLGGAVALGVLVTVFDAAGTTGDGPRELLAGRVSADAEHERAPAPEQVTGSGSEEQQTAERQGVGVLRPRQAGVAE